MVIMVSADRLAGSSAEFEIRGPLKEGVLLASLLCDDVDDDDDDDDGVQNKSQQTKFQMVLDFVLLGIIIIIIIHP